MRPKFRYSFELDEYNNVTKAIYHPKVGFPIEYNVNSLVWEILNYKITDKEREWFPYKKLAIQMDWAIYQLNFQIYNI